MITPAVLNSRLDEIHRLLVSSVTAKVYVSIKNLDPKKPGCVDGVDDLKVKEIGAVAQDNLKKIESTIIERTEDMLTEVLRNIAEKDNTPKPVLDQVFLLALFERALKKSPDDREKENIRQQILKMDKGYRLPAC